MGIRVIDNDHRELFEIINGIAAAVMGRHAPGVVAGRLDRLMRHSREHFPIEERFMEQAKFPGLAEQKADHERFIRTLQGFQERCAKDTEGLDTDRLLAFLKDWVTTHVLKHDIAMIPYLKGER